MDIYSNYFVNFQYAEYLKACSQAEVFDDYPFQQFNEFNNLVLLTDIKFVVIFIHMQLCNKTLQNCNKLINMFLSTNADYHETGNSKLKLENDSQFVQVF